MEGSREAYRRQEERQVAPGSPELERWQEAKRRDPLRGAVCSQGSQRKPGWTGQIWTSGHDAATQDISCSNAARPLPAA